AAVGDAEAVDAVAAGGEQVDVHPVGAGGQGGGDVGRGGACPALGVTGGQGEARGGDRIGEPEVAGGDDLAGDGEAVALDLDASGDPGGVLADRLSGVGGGG